MLAADGKIRLTYVADTEQLFRFSDEQIVILKKIKEVFASNLVSKRDIDTKQIFGTPIYEYSIGTCNSINQKFNGKFNTVISGFKQTFQIRAIF